MFVSLDSGGVKFIYHARHEKQRKANMIAKLRQHKCQECYQAVVQRGAIFKNKFAEKFFLPKKICNNIRSKKTEGNKILIEQYSF